MPAPLRVLLVEDSEADAFLLQRELRREGFDLDLTRVYSQAALETELKRENWDIVVSDYNLPGFDGMRALQVVRNTGLDLPFILISGAVGEETAVEAMKAGAQDYIKKDNLRLLAPAIRREINEAQVRRERRQVKELYEEIGTRYRTLFENVPVGVYRTKTGSRGSFLMANPAFLAMLGYSSLEDLAALSLADLFVDELEPNNFFHDLTEKGSLNAVDIHLRRKNGSSMWGLATARISYDMNGDPSHIDGILEDITERKQSERIKQALYEISQATITSQDLYELMKSVHHIVDQLMPAANFYLALYNPQTKLISFPYFIDQVDSPPEPHTLNRGLTAYVIRSGKPILASPEVFNTLLESGEIEAVGAPSLDWLGVPLKTADNKIIGAIVVQTYDAVYRYTQHDLEVLSFVSSQAAMAIERKRAELELQEQRSFLRLVIDISPNLIFTKDREGRFTLANQALAQIYGTSVEKLLGKTEADFNANHREVDAFRQDDLEVLNHQTEKFIEEEHLTDAKGRRHYLQTVKLPLVTPGNDEVQVLGVSTDITERKNAEEALVYNATHDALTRLPNRNLLLDRLGRALERARRRSDALFAVLMLDLDRFRLVNESLGHHFGDRLIIAASARLEACLRTVDTVARLGGDEFAILLEDLDSVSNVSVIAERLIEEMALPFYMDGHTIRITTSIGIVLSSSNYEKPEDVLRDADVALHRSKDAGGGRFDWFSSIMRADILAHLELATDLRNALDRNEFVLHYEPIVHVKDNALHGFEALVRWRHPKRGIVPPVEFIRFAEETNLIIRLGRWVLGEACYQMKAWHDQFPEFQHLNISVNLSGKQFAEANLVEQVEQALNESGLNPHCLRLEITESVIIENAENAIFDLNRLRSMGVLIDIDDFGTGVSNLLLLRRLPLHAIKIDRSFISGSEEMTDGMEFVRFIIDLANTEPKKDTIAEGVETQAQLERIRELGCQYAQGYLFSRSMPADVAESYIQRIADSPRQPTGID